MEHPQRMAEWGNWGITLYSKVPGAYLADSFFGFIPFGVGPQGPIDGFIGSELRESYKRKCAEWSRGECPDGAVCYLDQKWLYSVATSAEVRG